MFLVSKKRVVSILLVLIFVGIIVFLSSSVTRDESVAMYFCDVGQGDATLIQFGYFQMLIDAGPDEKVLNCLAEKMPFGDIFIEIAVVTHADIDHFKGYKSVLNKYFIGEMWLAEFDKDTTDFTDFKQLLLRKVNQGIKIRLVSQGDVLRIGANVVATVLWPTIEQNNTTETILSDDNLQFGGKEKWENDLSIVLKMDIYDTTVLLTGDIERNTEQALTRDNLIGKVDVLKVAHHGSKTSSTELFLSKTQPEIAAISSGKNNQHGHPAAEVLDAISNSRASVFRTDQLSTFGLLFERGKGIKILKKD
jgi:competence protein ComEC